MKYISAPLGCLLALSLSSCGVRDESQPLFGSPDSSTGVSVAAAAATDGTPTDSTLTGENNPGEVQTNIVAELSSVSTLDANALRGHKILAGNPSLYNSGRYDFVNIDFPCSGDGRAEAMHAPFDPNAPTADFGRFVWVPSQGDSADHSWAVSLSSGEFSDLSNPGAVVVSQLAFGEIIVDVSFIEGLPVTRIVHYDDCG